MEKKQWKDLSKTEKWVTSISLGIFALLMVSIFSGFSSDTSSNKNNSQNKKSQEEINLKITKNGYGDIIVKVLNDFDWSDCRYKINDKFELNGSYELFSQKNLSESGIEEQTIATRLFTDKDGLRFDPNLYEINVFSGSCSKPYISSFYLEKK